MNIKDWYGFQVCPNDFCQDLDRLGITEAQFMELLGEKRLAQNGYAVALLWLIELLDERMDDGLRLKTITFVGQDSKEESNTILYG